LPAKAPALLSKEDIMATPTGIPRSRQFATEPSRVQLAVPRRPWELPLAILLWVYLILGVLGVIALVVAA
jgi:hypothetical protein